MSTGRFVDASRQARSLEQLAHRPWPLPPEPWIIGQTWNRLLFAHWRVPHDLLRPHVPASLELEEFDGSSWLGLTPFRVAGLRLRGIPPLPLASSFLELNCRTYVRRGERPGIWFFSLHASSRLAVAAARRTYGLPYRTARITMGAGTFALEGSEGMFRAKYSGLGDPVAATPGSLEHFLTERYCLYGRGGTVSADIHHPPWPLERADAKVEQHRIAPVDLQGRPMCHYSTRQDVVIWRPRPT